MSEYAKSGVDPSKIGDFKSLMKEVCEVTNNLPEWHGLQVITGLPHPHGGVFRVGGQIFCITTEGPGNQPWASELMYQIDELDGVPIRRGYHIVSGINTIMMASNDCVAQGARPIICTDLVAATSSDWFVSGPRTYDLAEGIRRGCREAGCALVAGESASMKYIINAKSPVRTGLDLVATVVGLVERKEHLITGEKLRPGSAILGFAASGVHANGWTLLLDKIRELPQGFRTMLDEHTRVMDELLTGTRSYARLVLELLACGIEIDAVLPGTGDGVAKLASDPREYTYRIDAWPGLPRIYTFMQKVLGLPLEEILSVFNCGVGYYIFVPSAQADRTLSCAEKLGYPGWKLGVVEAGKRGVAFPRGIWLDPKA